MPAPQMKPKILVFAGSARKGSVNKKLAAVAADMARVAGADVTHIDMADHALPLYDGDLEAEVGLPPEVASLKETFAAHDGLIVVAPEYNGSITPMLKNTIDWVSRPGGDSATCLAFRGRVAGLLSASPGALGGLRGLVHVRQILAGIGMHVVPGQFALKARDAFDDAGGLVNEADITATRAVVEATVDLAKRVRG